MLDLSRIPSVYKAGAPATKGYRAQPFMVCARLCARFTILMLHDLDYGEGFFFSHFSNHPFLAPRPIVLKAHIRWLNLPL